MHVPKFQNFETCGLLFASGRRGLLAAPQSMAAAVRAIRQKKKQRLAENARDWEAEVKATFDKYDADGSGDIDKDELRSAFKDLGLDVPRSKMGAVLKRYGGNDCEGLTYDEFSALVADLTGHHQKGTGA